MPRTRIVLLHHTPAEWAAKFEVRLRALGCSKAHAAAEAARIRSLVRPVPTTVGIRWEAEESRRNEVTA